MAVMTPVGSGTLAGDEGQMFRLLELFGDRVESIRIETAIGEMRREEIITLRPSHAAGARSE